MIPEIALYKVGTFFLLATKKTKESPLGRSISRQSLTNLTRNFVLPPQQNSATTDDDTFPHPAGPVVTVDTLGNRVPDRAPANTDDEPTPLATSPAPPAYADQLMAESNDEPEIAEVHILPPPSAAAPAAATTGQRPGLFGGLQMPTLSAFRPVIDAMAGLIQHNFPFSRATALMAGQLVAPPPPPSSPLTSPPPPGALPLVALPPAATAEPQQQQPAYIPVALAQHQLQSQSAPHLPLAASLRDQHHHHHHQFHQQQQQQPSSSVRTHWLHEHEQRTAVQAALSGSGIPISPGEHITANSDVIVGRPSVPGPAAPLKQPQPPPPVVVSAAAEPLTSGSAQSQRYVGPPPPLPAPSPDDGEQRLVMVAPLPQPPQQQQPQPQQPPSKAHPKRHYNEVYVGPPPPPAQHQHQQPKRNQKDQRQQYKHIELVSLFAIPGECSINRW